MPDLVERKEGAIKRTTISCTLAYVKGKEQ